MHTIDSSDPTVVTTPPSLIERAPGSDVTTFERPAWAKISRELADREVAKTANADPFTPEERARMDARAAEERAARHADNEDRRAALQELAKRHGEREPTAGLPAPEARLSSYEPRDGAPEPTTGPQLWRARVRVAIQFPDGEGRMHTRELAIDASPEVAAALPDLLAGALPPACEAATAAILAEVSPRLDVGKAASASPPPAESFDALVERARAELLRTSARLSELARDGNPNGCDPASTLTAAANAYATAVNNR